MTSSVEVLEVEGVFGLSLVGREQQGRLEQEEKGSYIESRREGFMEGGPVLVMSVGQRIMHLLLEMTRALSRHCL